MIDLPANLRPGVRQATVALCHGCFDVIHFGHINHLESAASLADHLIVSITDDSYIEKAGRPIFSATERKRVLGALRFVDHVVLVAAPNAIPIIELLKPEYFVKGNEYSNLRRRSVLASQFSAERDLVLSYGGIVAFTDEPVWSTTETLERLTRTAPWRDRKAGV